MLCHGFLITAIIVVPFLDAETNLPQLKVIDSIKLVVEPSIPNVMVGKKGSTKKSKMREQKVKQKAEQKTANLAKMVAPVDIPEEIEDENIESGFDGDLGKGVEGGIAEGNLDGIDGGVSSELFSGGPQMERFIPTRARAPKLLKEVPPVYPMAARRAHIEGVVVIEAVTDVYGRVKKARVVRGHPLLNRSALEAVKQWIYQPYVIAGMPKPVIFSVTVYFRLNRD